MLHAKHLTHRFCLSGPRPECPASCCHRHLPPRPLQQRRVPPLAGPGAPAPRPSPSSRSGTGPSCKGSYFSTFLREKPAKGERAGRARLTQIRPALAQTRGARGAVRRREGSCLLIHPLFHPLSRFPALSRPPSLSHGGRRLPGTVGGPHTHLSRSEAAPAGRWKGAAAAAAGRSRAGPGDRSAVRRAGGRNGARAAGARLAPLRSGARGCRRAAMTSRGRPPIASPGRGARARALWRHFPRERREALPSGSLEGEPVPCGIGGLQSPAAAAVTKQICRFQIQTDTTQMMFFESKSSRVHTPLPTSKLESLDGQPGKDHSRRFEALKYGVI